MESYFLIALDTLAQDSRVLRILVWGVQLLWGTKYTVLHHTGSAVRLQHRGVTIPYPPPPPTHGLYMSEIRNF